MQPSLEEMRRVIEMNPRMVGFIVRQTGEELILSQEGERFARLMPVKKAGLSAEASAKTGLPAEASAKTGLPAEASAKAGWWRLSYYRNLGCWRKHVEFSGPLEACLDVVAGGPHYLFWGQ
jgi:hypothetical protein